MMNGQPSMQKQRSVVAQSIPMDANQKPIFTSEQISDFEAVLDFEMLRKSQASRRLMNHLENWVRIASCGPQSKSALLNRIASGLWPFVVPPPVSMSYPWYEVVEGDAAHELWIDHATADELIAAGCEHQSLMRSLEGRKTIEGAARLLKSFFSDRTVLINQSFWKVVRKVGDVHLEVTWPGWDELGFLWRLSIDEIPAKEAHQVICAWHNPQLAKITTFEQLVLEQRWHINKRIDEMRCALGGVDGPVAQRMLNEAKEKDGESSRFHQYSIQQNLAAKLKMVEARIAEGKPPIPHGEEVESMVNDAIEKYLKPRSNSGSGWYSVASDGSLVLHTWRIQRIAPITLPQSIYLDAASLPRSQKKDP